MSDDRDPKRKALDGLASMVGVALDTLRKQLTAKEMPRNAAARTLAAKYVLDAVLDAREAEKPAAAHPQLARLTPEAAVLELRKRLGAK